MSEWKSDELENLLDTLIDYRGKTPKKTDSGIPLITAKIIKGGTILPYNEYIAEDDYDSWMVRGFPKSGDVVLTAEAPLGEVAQLDDTKIALAQRVVCLRGKNGVLDNKYLKYYFMSKKGHQALCSRESGTTVTGIKQSELRKVKVTFPPFEVQKKIASVISSFDDKIAVNHRICENLEAQAQALFKSWFIDFEPFKDGKFVETELGMIPEGWKVNSLTDIADFQNGLAMQKYPPLSDDDSIPVLKIKELGQSYCDSNSDRCTKNLKPEFIVHDGDVVFSWSGTLLVDLWCGGICGLNQHLFKVTSSQYSKWFYLMWTKHHLAEFIRIAKDKAVTMGHIKRGDLDKAFVLIPDDSTFERISPLMNVIIDKIISLRLESARLATLRDTLLPKLMSGQITL
jgi:type I restriction enzyme S subunit